MLKLICLCLSLTFLLDAAIPQQNCPQSSKYTNSENEYTLQFPERWQVERNFMGLDAFAASPSIDQNENRSEANISVQSSSLKKEYTLNEFYSENVTPLSSGLTDFKILETGNVLLNGVRGKMILYNHSTQEGLKLRVKQYFVVNDHKGYIITGSSIANEFDRYTPMFESTAKTLRFFKL